MSNNNTALYLSEGTCYFGAGTPSDAAYLPCGNADLSGPQACCYKNSYCLESNTCFDMTTKVTYIAGCTDSQFLASVCPQRNNYPNQQWVALARCDGADENLWSGCGRHPNEIALEKENCSCNKSNVLINNPATGGTFPEVGLLPNATGQPIDFAGGVLPTLLSSSDDQQSGLSKGAQAGIGVGVGIAGLLIIGALVFLFLRLRKNKQKASHDTEKRSSELDGHHGQQYEAGAQHKVEAPGDRGNSINDSNKAELFTEGQIGELNNTNKYNGEVKGASGV